MVSKTVLACLAVLASISMIQGTVLPPLQGFNSCVQGLGFMNFGLGLGFDLGNLLGDILGVAANIINVVLSTLQNILVGVLATAGSIIDGFLRGIFGGAQPSTPHVIPYPSSVDKFILTQAKFATVYDKVFQNKFGRDWQAGALVNVYLNIANLLSAQLGIGGSVLGSVPSISATRKQCSLILAKLGALQNDSNFQGIGSLLSFYFNLLGDDDQSINEQTFLDANSYLIKIQAGLLHMCGYPAVPAYTDAFAQAYNSLDFGERIPGVLNVDLNLGGNNGIPYDCGCLKN